MAKTSRSYEENKTVPFSVHGVQVEVRSCLRSPATHYGWLYRTFSSTGPSKFLVSAPLHNVFLDLSRFISLLSEIRHVLIIEIWIYPSVFAARVLYISAAYAVMRCLSVPFVDFVKTNKRIFKFFSPLGSQAILVLPCQTAWQYSDRNPLKRASNAGGVGRNRDSEPTSGFTACCQRCARQVLSTSRKL